MAKNNKAPRGETFVGFRPSIHDDGRDKIYKGGSYTDKDINKDFDEELKHQEEDLHDGIDANEHSDFSEVVDNIHKQSMHDFMDNNYPEIGDFEVYE